MYKVTLSADNSLFAFDFSNPENLSPIFVKIFNDKSKALAFFNNYVKENQCTKANRNARFAHHNGKEISCNF